jgi:hypothetical protein
MRDTNGWVTSGSKINDSGNLTLVEQALGRGPIFLRHALYHGCGSPHWDTATRYEQFLEHLSHSKPGDWFYVWSIPDLIGKNLHFLNSHYASFELSSEQGAKDFSQIKEFLGTGDREVFLAFIPAKSQDPKAAFNDIDGYDELAAEFTGFPYGHASDCAGFVESWRRSTEYRLHRDPA